MTDEQGLNHAYNDPNGVHYDETSKTLFVAGTDIINRPSDLYADLQIPIGNLANTQRYKQVQEIVNLYKPVNLTGHSLGSAVILQLNKEHGNIYRTKTYGSPTISAPWEKGANRYARIGDLISAFDTAAHHSLPSSFNPHSYSGIW